MKQRETETLLIRLAQKQVRSLPYTAEEAKWLVEKVQIANLDDFPLLKATYCGLPDADRTKCSGS